MFCLTTILLTLGSRITIFIWWLMDPQRFNLAFQNWILPGNFAFLAWVWALLGAIFLPWTTLAYLLVFPGGIVGYEWIVILVAFLIDVAGHSRSYSYRDRIPAYRRRQTI